MISKKSAYILLSCLALTSFANENSVRPALAFTAGAAFVSGLDDSEEFELGLSRYNYQGQDNQITRGLFGALIGAEFPVYPNLTLQMGIAYYQPSSSLPVNGTLIQGVDASSSDQSAYQYKIQSRQLLLDNKLLMEWKEHYHPYISVGLGAVFNTAEGYEVGSSCLCDNTALYEAHTQTSFSYNLGLGLDYDVAENVRFGLGYRFTGLGKAALGSGELLGASVSSSPGELNLYAQEVLGQLTYFIW